MRSLVLSAVVFALPALAQDVDAGTAAPTTGRIVVTVTGLRSDKGFVEIALFENDSAFPGKPKQSKEVRYLPVEAKGATTTFEGLKPGWYAIGTCHDEDGNKECKANFLGIPLEGVACSNNAHHKNLIPQFEKARFWVNAGQTQQAPVSEYKY